MNSKIILIFFYFTYVFNNPILINGGISDKKIKYHKIPIQKDVNNKIKDIIIKSELKNISNSSDLPIYLVSYKNLPNSKKFSQKICGKIGDECYIESNFISKTNSKYLSLAVFCEKCSYSFNIDYTQNLMNNGKFKTRLLQVQNTDNQPSNIEEENKAYGVAGVVVLIFFSLCVILISTITMQIFVNTKLVDKSLRLGRVEN